MASVRLKAGSDHWFACFKLPTGTTDSKGRLIFRRVQRSTGTTEKDRALQLAISYERAAVMAAEKRWSENSARRFLDEIRSLTGASVGEVEPANGFLTRWLASRKTMVTARTWTKYEAILKAFLSFLGPGASGPIIDVTPARVAAYRDASTAGGNSPATVNKALMVLGQALAEAVRTGLLETNPARGLNVRGGAKRKQKRLAFAFAQFRELVQKTAPDYVVPDRTNYKDFRLHADWQTFVLVAGYTGGRQQEVAQLRWDQVDFARSVLRLDRSKNDDSHLVPLHPALSSHLQKIRPAGKSAGFVMPYLARLERRAISKTFRLTILPRIGIVQPFEKREGQGTGRTLAKYSVHSLRHSLSTWLEEAGVSEMMRMRLVGHEDEEVSRGYTHTELAAAAAALGKLPAV